MKLVGVTIVSTTLALLGSLGCGADSPDTSGGNLGNGASSGNGGSSGTGGSSSTGCNQPDCFSLCYCETQSMDGCVQACRDEGSGGSGGAGVGGSGATGTGGTGATATGGTGAIGTGGSGTGGTSTGGAGGATHEIFEFNMQPFTVGPGEEAFACQNFANPSGSSQLVFIQTSSFMTPGSHHMFLMEDGSNVNGPLETEQTNPNGCNGLQFSTMVHSAQTPQVDMKYPPGVGAKLNGGVGLRMIAHYLNTTTAPITTEVRVLVYVANPGEVTQLAGFLFGNVIGLRVGAGQLGSARGSVTIPYDVGLLNFVSHMHSHATNFVATVNGQQLYQTTEWDAPEPVVFNPTRNIAGGSVIDWTCSYDNTSGTQALTFGESARTNEMCIINGRVITPNGDPLTFQIF